MEINFNSKRSSPPGFSELSNFYGGVEFQYMKMRFTQSEIKAKFDRLEVCENPEFWQFLQILNPKGTKKKPVTQKQMDYWFTRGGIANGKPIRGIAAQLLGTMVRPSASKRRKAVMAELKLDSIDFVEELPDFSKQSKMKECLREKYSIEPYRSLLLSTGRLVLHEMPLRGNGGGNNWTYKEKDGEIYGKDWLGQLLMEIRTEILSQKRSAEDASGTASSAKKQRVSEVCEYKQYILGKETEGI
jgi:hypothetical protein